MFRYRSHQLFPLWWNGVKPFPRVNQSQIMVGSYRSYGRIIRYQLQPGQLMRLTPCTSQIILWKPIATDSSSSRARVSTVTIASTPVVTSWWEKAVETTVPRSLLPYVRIMRLEKPIGTWLLLLPCCWGMALATPAGCLPSPFIFTMVTLQAFMMRGAGCIINDLWDRDFDRQVERTKNRPLASGELSTLDAIALLSLTLGASSLSLTTFNINSILVALGSLTPVVTYPLMKRITNWPQLVLGATFNWGVILGYSIVSGGDMTLLPLAVPLYVSGICWTLVYDTIYAHQDKMDDARIGVKSTALRFGENTKPWLSAFSGGMVGNLLLTGYLTGQTWPFYVSVAATSGHLAHQIWQLKMDDTGNCWTLFRRNSQIGVILLAGIILSTLIKKEEGKERRGRKEDKDSISEKDRSKTTLSIVS